jgi:TonB-dependent starch-binding outer membrane protein SusC
MRQRLIRTLALMLVSSASVASSGLLAQQTGVIRGRILELRTLRPLDGAQVYIPDTPFGVLTNSAGEYRIRGIPAGEVELRVEIIGHQSASRTVTVTQGRETEVNFDLEPLALELEGVMVTVTGGQRTRELGTTIAKIDATDVVDAPLTQFSDLVQGRAAGVQVLESGGTTGTGTRIRIRGSNSISLSNEPLVYIDGVRISTISGRFGDNATSNAAPSISFETGGQSPSRFEDLNPDEIESIEIVKGPSAATLYGTQAANGVIWITTKRGRSGKARWRAYIEQGAVKEPNTYPSNFRAFDASGNDCLLFDVAAGSCTQASFESFNPLEHGHTTPFRTGRRQQYGLNVSGGTPGLTYFLSGEFENEDGVTQVNALESIRLRGNFNAQIRDNLQVAVSNGYVSNDLTLPLNDNFALGVITNGMAGFWTDTINNGYGEFTPAELFTIDTRQELDRYTGGLTVNWSPFKFLETRGTVGLDQVNRLDSQFYPTGEAPAFLGRDAGARFSNRFQSKVLTVDFGGTAAYGVASNVSSRTSAGFQYFREELKGTFASGLELVAGSNSLAGAASTVSGERQNEFVSLGAYVEQVFAFSDRLFLSGALRFDDASSFGTDFDVTIFPKFGASWVISEESFFGNPLGINDLRLRAALGSSGLQPGPTDAITFFNPVAVTTGGASTTGVTFGGVGNPDLKPERSREIEAGLDAQFLQNRVGLQFTYYNKKTTDALIFRQLPPSLGVSDGRFENLGSVRNSGLEALLTARVLENPTTTWDFTFNASTNSSELVELGAGIEPIIFRFQRHVEGFPVGGYWDFPILGFSDANGDGIIAQDEVQIGSEEVFLGSPFPKRQLAIQSSFVLGMFRLRGLLDHRGGQKLLNFTEAWRLGQNTTQSLNDPNTPLDEQARAVASKFLGTDAGYFENASFWKLREVSLTFFAPRRWATSIGADAFSVTVSGRNLFTITDYTGIDPELNETGQSNFTTREFMTQGPVRFFTARVDVTF